MNSKIRGKFCKPETISEIKAVENALEKCYGNPPRIDAGAFIGYDYDGFFHNWHRISHDTGELISVHEFIELLESTHKSNKADLSPQYNTKIRRFPTGAIRSDNTGRERYDFISPLAMKALAEYLANTENKFAQINYFKGIPEDACVESMMRHLYDYRINGTKKEAVGILFNAVALVHTIMLRERGEYKEIYQQTELINKSDFKDE